MMLKNKFCKYCGKEFSPNCNVQVYCSYECKRAFYRKHVFVPKITVCSICGKRFLKRTHNNRYCSTECYQKRHGYTPKDAPKEIKVCLWCHGEFKTEFGAFKKFCCPVCAYKYKQIEYRLNCRYDSSEELERLNRLGQNYRFPIEWDNENVFYFGHSLREFSET